MKRLRLDQALVTRGMVRSRSQAESYIKLGHVTVNGKILLKPGQVVSEADKVSILNDERYVSRAALKLASVAEELKLDFAKKVVLDVGSSTGGFTDFSLQHHAKRVIAVEVGTQQLHDALRGNPLIELHEQTDIRDITRLSSNPDIVLIDVSFISLQDILPHIAKLVSGSTEIITMVKPQFEAGKSNLKHKGVIKNDTMRRQILRDFEQWSHQYFVILDKADSKIRGAKGNQERFYKLKKVR